MKTENMLWITTDFDDNKPPRKRIKPHDLRICTWNVRSLNKLDEISQLETVLKDYKTDIIALQEMRWTDQGRTNLSTCDVYYSAMLLGTNSGVALQCAGMSETRLKIYCR